MNKITKFLSESTGKKVTNAMLLNTIRSNCGEAYQRDIPRMDDFKPINHGNVPYSNYIVHQNEFFNQLIDRIGLQAFKALSFKSPLGVFKTEDFKFGNTYEEIYVGLADEQDFDAKSNISPFRYADTKITTFYHDVSREKMYERTIEKEWTIKAFASDNAFDSFIDKMLESLISTDTLSEFEFVKQLITDSLTEVNVAPPPSQPILISTKSQFIDIAANDWVLDFNKELIKRSNLMAVPSKTRFENAANVPKATPIEEQFFICSADVSSEMDSMLANAFNLSKASVLAKKIVIDEFPIFQGAGTLNGAKPIAALLSKDSLIIKDKLIRLANVWNERNMSYNYFLHHHQLLSMSLLENARIYYYMP